MHSEAEKNSARRAHRQRTFLGAKLLYGGSFSADCVMRNISDGGAMLELPANLAIPDNVQLIDLRAGTVFEADVVWRRYPCVGVEFISQHNLKAEVEGRFFVAKRLWMSTRQLQSE